MDGIVKPAGEGAALAAPSAHQVHLWRAPLDVSPRLTARFADTLSEGEHERVARLRFATDRSRYANGRGWLRHMLGGYLDADPATLAFVADAHGKPRLTNPPAPWLHFNLSHSGAMVVFAVACDREVGVDVERVREDVDVDGVAQRSFTAPQRRELAGMPSAARTPAFYAMWTRNEAYLKATGVGLAGAGMELEPPSGWLVTAFDAGPGYAAAVAVQRDCVEVPPAATHLAPPRIELA